MQSPFSYVYKNKIRENTQAKKSGKNTLERPRERKPNFLTSVKKKPERKEAREKIVSFNNNANERTNQQKGENDE